MGETLTRRALRDPSSEALSEPLRATLRFLEKVTLTPNDVTGEDARAVLRAGVSRAAIIDALHVAFLFNTYDRLADTLGWAIPAPEVFRRSAKMLLSRGYA